MPPPVPTIDSKPPDPGIDRSARFEFSDSQAGVAFLTNLDGAGFVASVSPLFYPGPLAAGNHVFRVKANDGADSAVASYTWRVPFSIEDLEQSVESKILRALVARIRGDQIFADIFKPILLVENVTLQALLLYANNTAVVLPWSIKPTDEPSKRETVLFAALVAFYLPSEQTSEDSALRWLRLYNRLRGLIYSTPVLIDPDIPNREMNFANTRVEPLTPIRPADRQNTEILSCRVILETDIRSPSGQLAS